MSAFAVVRKRLQSRAADDLIGGCYLRLFGLRRMVETTDLLPKGLPTGDCLSYKRKVHGILEASL